MPICEKCHVNGMERIILRQSEEILCEGCWKGNGYPPFYVESGSQDQNAEEVEEDCSNEEDEVDHSYRFTSFSTPSILLSTSLNQQIQETQASSPLVLSRPPPGELMIFSDGGVPL